MAILTHLLKNSNLSDDLKKILSRVFQEYSWALPEECFVLLVAACEEELREFWEKFRKDGYAFLTVSLIDAEILNVYLADYRGDVICSKSLRLEDGEAVENIKYPKSMMVLHVGEIVRELAPPNVQAE